MGKVTTLEVVPEQEVENDEITLRPIVTKDLFTIVKVVVPRLDMIRLRQVFTDMPKGAAEREEYFRIAGMEIISMVLMVVTEDAIQEWLADLAGMTLQTFLDSPVETPFRIVMALGQNVEMRKIFTTLLQ